MAETDATKPRAESSIKLQIGLNARRAVYSFPSEEEAAKYHASILHEKTLSPILCSQDVTFDLANAAQIILHSDQHRLGINFRKIHDAQEWLRKTKLDEHFSRRGSILWLGIPAAEEATGPVPKETYSDAVKTDETGNEEGNKKETKVKSPEIENANGANIAEVTNIQQVDRRQAAPRRRRSRNRSTFAFRNKNRESSDEEAKKSPPKWQQRAIGAVDQAAEHVVGWVKGSKPSSEGQGATRIKEEGPMRLIRRLTTMKTT